MTSPKAYAKLAQTLNELGISAEVVDCRGGSTQNDPTGSEEQTA